MLCKNGNVNVALDKQVLNQGGVVVPAEILKEKVQDCPPESPAGTEPLIHVTNHNNRHKNDSDDSILKSGVATNRRMWCEGHEGAVAVAASGVNCWVQATVRLARNLLI